MNSHSPINNNSVPKGVELELELLITGAISLPATTQIVVDNVTYTPATFAERVRAELAPFKAARNAKVLYRQALADRREHQAPAKVFVANARAALQGALGTQNAELEKFGVKPRKDRRQPSLEERLAALGKAKATRAGKTREPTPGSSTGPTPPGGTTPTTP